jgi:response regulator RpfG family c-di-GMP phosphodiesterase
VKRTTDEVLGRTVLLVEDDAATRGMIARHLRGSGFDVTAVESAEEVILRGAEAPATYDVVISDVHLPGTSGLDLASHLLKHSPTQPILLITGDPDEALARDALSRGPVSYLLKPFELFELDAAIRQALLRGSPRTVEKSVNARGEAVAASGGHIPENWLEFVDEQSYAGPGHAERVARIAVTLVGGLPDQPLDMSSSELALAARTHEMGRLGGPTADPADMAVRGAELLAEAGFPDPVVRAVRHLHERWDGSGGPEHLTGAEIPLSAQVLSAADSLDHYCSAWIQAGMRPVDAVDRAVSLVIVQQGSLFNPVVAGAVHRERGTIRAICTAGQSADGARSDLRGVSADELG